MNCKHPDFSTKKDRQIRQYIAFLIVKYRLDLSDKIVFTEYATGNYYYTAVAARMAGAKVFAYTPPCRSDKGIEDPKYIEDEVLEEGIIKTSFRGFIRQADIITNSGRVRPITYEDIYMMKPTAVIALMMMKSQVRRGDVDFYLARKQKIRLASTDELALGILDSIPFKIMKVCFEAGLSVWNDRFFLFSSGEIGVKIKKFFEKMEVSVNIKDTNNFYDAIIISNYTKRDGNDERLRAIIDKLAGINPDICLIWISGGLDIHYYVNKGLNIYPLWSKLVDYNGKTNVSGDYLSYKVTLELNVASLKAASKKRIS